MTQYNFTTLFPLLIASQELGWAQAEICTICVPVAVPILYRLIKAVLKHPRIGRHIHRAEALERVSRFNVQTAPERRSEGLRTTDIASRSRMSVPTCDDRATAIPLSGTRKASHNAQTFTPPSRVTVRAWKPHLFNPIVDRGNPN